jgi:hypothetical protein
MNRPALEKAIKDETEVAVTLERYIGRDKIPVCRRAVVLAVKVPRDPFFAEQHRPSGVRVRFVDEPLDEASRPYSGRARALAEQGSEHVVISREVYEHWSVYAPVKAQRDHAVAEAEAASQADLRKIEAVKAYLGVGGGSRVSGGSRERGGDLSGSRARYSYTVAPDDLDALIEQLSWMS